MNFFARLKVALGKSSSFLGGELNNIFTQRKLDQAMLDQLEETLIMADIGANSSVEIVDAFGKKRFGKEITINEAKEALSQEISELITPYSKEFKISAIPTVIMVAGVNGNGKTTTIGKLARYFNSQGKRTLIAACDTFRAAATSQLYVWAERTNTKIVVGANNSDPASVAFRSFEEAKKESFDILLIDTAGRLHNNQTLMDELTKITRVLKKIDKNAPHEILLVIDATTGQNAIQQVEVFSQRIPLTGLIITKLDGTAKGGIIIPIMRHFKLPVYFIGTGEKLEDLRPFEPKDYALALLGN